MSGLRERRVAGRAAHRLVDEFELGAFERADAAFPERAALAAHAHLRVEELDVAVEFDAALLRVDRGLVGGEQALAHANLDVAAQFGIAGAAEFAGVAGDVDLRVVRIGLEQFFDARIDDRHDGARVLRPVLGLDRRRPEPCAGCRVPQRGLQRLSQARGTGARRRHPGDYNCARFAASDYCPPAYQPIRGFRLHDTRPQLPVSGQDDPRLALLRQWLEQDLGFRQYGIAPASADASFRRYFRVTRAGHAALIVMDAPPGKEDVGPYLRVAAMLQEIGVHGPRILERSERDGFLLLTDLGTTMYLPELAKPGQADPLYADALAALVQIQSRGATVC